MMISCKEEFSNGPGEERLAAELKEAREELEK